MASSGIVRDVLCFNCYFWAVLMVSTLGRLLRRVLVHLLGDNEKQFRLLLLLIWDAVTHALYYCKTLIKFR